MFSILLTDNIYDEALMQFGGYSNDYFDSSINEITAHRISGSFHWEIHIVGFDIAGSTQSGLNPPLKKRSDYFFKPVVHQALTDTGTSVIMLPKSDYKLFRDQFCNYLKDNTQMTCMS